MTNGDINPSSHHVDTDPAATVCSALQRLNEHAVDGYIALGADDLVYASMTTVKGMEAARALDEAALAKLPDHWRRIDRLLVSGDTVAIWLTFGGTPAGKEPFEAELCDIFEVRDGLIHSITTYANWPVMMERLGL